MPSDNEPGRISRLTGSFEGGLFLSGLIITVFFVLWLALSPVWIPGKAHLVLAVTGAHVTAGRAAGIYLGLSAGLNLDIVFVINIIVDTLWIMLMYPIVIFTMNHLLNYRWINKTVKGVVKAAERNRPMIDKYGPFGLFVFVACPLPMTGPIVGGVIGKLIGLRNWANMGIVLLATYTALVFWAMVLVGVHHQMRDYGTKMAVLVLAVLVGAGLIGNFIYKKQHKKDGN